MNLSTYLLFVPIALVSICSPGPATLLAISNSMNYGVRRVHYSTLGNIIGQLIVASLAMMGVGVLLHTSVFWFEMVKIAGALYLIYLGIKQWRSKGVLHAHVQKNSIASSSTTIGLKGLALALSNPKDIFFFTALLPQFIHTDSGLLMQFAILVGSFMLFSYISLMTWALMAHRAKNWLNQEVRMRWFNRVTGGVFFILGISMLRIKRNVV